MKKFLAAVLALCILLSVSLAWAEEGLYVGPEDTYLNPLEEIVRDIHFAPFSFRGPEGWTQEPDPNSDALYVWSPDRQKLLVVYAAPVEGVDLNDDAVRKAAFDSMVQSYNGTSYADIGNGRYMIGNLGFPSVIYMYAEGSDLVVIAYMEKGESYEPKVSDLSPYARTLLHD